MGRGSGFLLSAACAHAWLHAHPLSRGAPGPSSSHAHRMIAHATTQSTARTHALPYEQLHHHDKRIRCNQRHAQEARRVQQARNLVLDAACCVIHALQTVCGWGGEWEGVGWGVCAGSGAVAQLRRRRRARWCCCANASKVAATCLALRYAAARARHQKSSALAARSSKEPRACSAQPACERYACRLSCAFYPQPLNTS